VSPPRDLQTFPHSTQTHEQLEIVAMGREGEGGGGGSTETVTRVEGDARVDKDVGRLNVKNDQQKRGPNPGP